MNTANLDLRELNHQWTNGGFVMRSGFYAGRSVSYGDLNSTILEQHYQGILKELGEVAATNYIRFVNKLQDLSASAYIVAFERFWASDCMEVEVSQRPADRNALSGRDDALFAEGLWAMASMLNNHHSEPEVKMMSLAVKSDFILKHRNQIPESERSRVYAFRDNLGAG